MNATIQTILSRRSVRRYTDRPVDDAVLNEIVRTAIYAPSAHGRHPFYGAPAVCVVLGDGSVDTCVEDGSLVIGYMMLAAQSLGVSSCWIHRAREVFETEEGKALLKKWGIPEGYIGIGHCALGYTDAPAPAAKTPKVDHVLYD